MTIRRTYERVLDRILTTCRSEKGNCQDPRGPRPLFGICHRETRLSEVSGFTGGESRESPRPDCTFLTTNLCGYDFRQATRTRVLLQHVFRNVDEGIIVEMYFRFHSSEPPLCWSRPVGEGGLQPDHSHGALGLPSPTLQRTYKVSNWHRLLPH